MGWSLGDSNRKETWNMKWKLGLYRGWCRPGGVEYLLAGY